MPNSASGPLPNEPVGVIGLGASAGGIGALQQFFQTMATDSDLAFVVIMHLSPQHESSLAEVLQPATAMPVVQVQTEVKVEPNHVYVIPPNKHLTMADGTLRLSERQQAPGRRVAIDLFFRTLAAAYGQRALCALLTGTDSDGVIGLKHIKAQGGVAIAQEPSEAEHDQMPRAAIETGMVDWVLPVREMPNKLLEFVRNEKRMELPAEDYGEAADGPQVATAARQTNDPEDENALQEVLRHLRAQTGHDFAHYKRATVLRRIARRLQVNSIEDIPAYLEFLRSHSMEGPALLQDLLIGVTHFFRDRDAFAALESYIPQLFTGKSGSDQVRVWVPACATGEEAYSIAMLLSEQAVKLENPPRVQIFATDIDEEAVAAARRGLYPAAIEADVSQERLGQFFSRNHGRYRLKKEIREMVLFAPHDILKDPPFSRLDLVSCRNLLIYLKRATQTRVLDIFHFALRPGGLLFVGGSESVEDAPVLFAPLDKHHRVYVRRAALRRALMIPALPLSSGSQLNVRSTLGREASMPPMSHPAIASLSRDAAETPGEAQERRTLLFGEIHLQLLEKYAAPSVVINDRHDIVHLSLHAGRYLRFGGGEPSANLFDLVHPALRVELRTAIFRARQSNTRISVSNIAIQVEDEKEVINLHVQPMKDTDAEHGYALVIFERKNGEDGKVRSSELNEPLVRHLEEELTHVKEQLSVTVEQYEASNEELKAANEELQAMNEEVRSTAEELETSKEELQSINEELSTVNQELKSNVEQLRRSNSDLQNLMSATDIGTIFLDRRLRIQRFTPPVQEIFNILPSDLGRPLSDITRKLKYPQITRDVEEVLAKLLTIDREVQGKDDLWFLSRIKPYRTIEDKIDGVVITFVDISQRKKVESELRKSSERIRRAFEVDTVGVIFFKIDGSGITDANEAFLTMSGYTRAELETGLLEWDVITPREWMPRLRQTFADLKETGHTKPYEKEYLRKDGSRWWGLAASSRIDEKEGVKYILDITDRKKAEEKLIKSEERFRRFAENSADVVWILNVEEKQLEYLSPAYDRVWGETREPIMRNQNRWEELLHPDDRCRVVDRLPRLARGETVQSEYRIIRPNDGATRWIRDIGFPVPNAEGKVTRVAGIAQDITEEKTRSEALATSEERFRLLIENTPDYAMFLLNLDNKIIYWSAGAERIFGYSSEEALGQSGQLIFTAQDRARGQEKMELEIALRHGFANDCRWHQRKDGSRVYIDGVMRRLDDEQGNLRGFAKIGRDATAQHEAEQALRRSHEELEVRVRERTADLTATNEKLQAEMRLRASLEQEILLVSEREKRRIGQDLHDSLCQDLAAAAFFLESTSRKLEATRPEHAKEFSDAARIVNANVGLARDLARGLHPVELSTSGLTNALRELAFRTSHGGIVCRFDCPRPVRVSDEAVALNLYRIAQEAVTNAIKNGKAKNIVFSLNRRRGTLFLSVRDDGHGFRVGNATKGMGLHIMKYRADVIGAAFTIESDDGATTVTCTLPSRSESKTSP